MTRFVQVEGFSGLVRDTESNAVLNTNSEEIELARERKRIARLKREYDASFEKRVVVLENDIKSIKNYLEVILQKLT